jgi:predicted RNA binding protein YcfA (HicA-like mRNA interferase family)
MNKEVRKYLRLLEKNGFTVKRSRSSHWKIYDGGKTLVGTVPNSPSDHRWLLNNRKEIEGRLTLNANTLTMGKQSTKANRKGN